jgi:hypothetical protein
MADRQTRTSPGRKVVPSARPVRTSPRRAGAKDGAKRARQSGAGTPRSGGYAVLAPTTRRRGRISTSRTLRGLDVVIHEHGVIIAGTEAAIEDFLDGREIDQRLADPANRVDIPWEDVKARRGL